MRLINILVIGLLVLAATYVYKIKFDSTRQAARVSALAGELRDERNAIARLRADWSKLDTPGRIEGLAQRHLPLRAIVATQFDSLDRLPDKPPQLPPADEALSVMSGPAPDTTGSITPKGARR